MIILGLSLKFVGLDRILDNYMRCEGKQIIKFEKIYLKNFWILYSLLYILHLKNSKFTQIFTYQISTRLVKNYFIYFFLFD